MPDQKHPSPEKIMQISSGAWSAGILGTAVSHSIFTHLEEGRRSAAAISQHAGLSERGVQAILDGLVGLGLIELSGGRYSNIPEASFYLVQGKPAYLGAYVTWNFEDSTNWAFLPEVVRSGVPHSDDTTDVRENPFWEKLVLAIAHLSVPVAQQAADRLGLAKAGAVSILDVGGGSGIYSAIWLKANPKARSTQIDWANVNRIARGFVGNFGVGDRFETIDGDFHELDFGSGKFDIAVYSHIAHQETPQDNIAVFKKFRKAIKLGGTLVVNDFVLNDDRTGHPFALMFTAMMLRQTKAGSTYRRAEYAAWAAEAGFRRVSFDPTPGAPTLIFAS